MENFTLDARQVKAAMVMSAKNDIRYYLNGLLIGGNKIVSTDGHRMMIIDSKEAEFEPTIFSIKGTLPASAINCEFVFIGDDHGVVTCTTGYGGEIDKVVKFAIIDGRFPDYNRVIPNGDCVEFNEICFNLEYMSDVSKAAKLLGNKLSIGSFKLYGEDAPKAVVEIRTPETKAKCIIMGARL